MHIFATFEHSTLLELALTELEQKGIPRNKILAVPLSRLSEERRLFDTMHHADGHSLLDGAAMLGTVFMILGVIWGFLWKWGPIFGGLTGLATGGTLGFLLDYRNSKRMQKKDNIKNLTTEVIVIVNCDQNQAQMIEHTLWNHLANSTGRLER